MSSVPKASLKTEEISRLASPYLSTGRKQEAWEIMSAEIDGTRASARIRMTDRYVSDTDSGGFHLTVFTALEVISQMSIIYGHVWAGASEKNREAWMVDCSVSCRKPVRDPESIYVDMQVDTIKSLRDNLLLVTNSRIHDDSGEIAVWLKGLLPKNT